MAHKKHFGADDIVRTSTLESQGAINITPFIDVLLVLIVIFLAALPLSQRGLDINLPLETRGADQSTADSSQIVMQYTADRVITVNQQPIPLQQLESRLREIFEARREKTIFFVGAGNLRYGEVIEVIDAARGAGVNKIGIVTEQMRRRGGADAL